MSDPNSPREDNQNDRTEYIPRQPSNQDEMEETRILSGLAHTSEDTDQSASDSDHEVHDDLHDEVQQRSNYDDYRYDPYRDEAPYDPHNRYVTKEEALRRELEESNDALETAKSEHEEEREEWQEKEEQHNKSLRTMQIVVAGAVIVALICGVFAFNQSSKRSEAENTLRTGDNSQSQAFNQMENERNSANQRADGAEQELNNTKQQLADARKSAEDEKSRADSLQKKLDERDDQISDLEDELEDAKRSSNNRGGGSESNRDSSGGNDRGNALDRLIDDMNSDDN